MEEVIRKYSNLVYRLAFARTGNRQDADDIYQEVFLRYVKKKPEFISEEHAKAWFIRVTLNCTNRFLGSPWRRRTEPLTEESLGEMWSMEDQGLWEEIQRLPGKYREVLHLFYYEDLSVETIGRILKRRESTVRTQLTRARRQLKELLQEV